MLWAALKPPDYFQGAFSWRREKGGGPILINLIHDIDNLRYICGEVTRVYAEASHKTRGFPVEDSVGVVLRLENDVLVNILMSDCVPANWTYDHTSGESPFFVPSPENCYYFFGTKAAISFPHLKKTFYPDASKAGWQHPVSQKEIHVAREDSYARQMRHFCKVVAGEEEPRVTGEDARRTLEVTLAVQRSAETGRPVNV
jgi:predicted dehydrogenase